MTKSAAQFVNLYRGKDGHVHGGHTVFRSFLEGQEVECANRDAYVGTFKLITPREDRQRRQMERFVLHHANEWNNGRFNPDAFAVEVNKIARRLRKEAK